MQLTSVAEGPEYHPDHVVARPLLVAEQCNVRIIKLGAGQALPAHRHGASDLMLYVVEGTGQVETPDGPAELAVGSLAHLRGDEELRLTNTGKHGMTLLAFLAPPFPPPS